MHIQVWCRGRLRWRRMRPSNPASSIDVTTSSCRVERQVGVQFEDSQQENAVPASPLLLSNCPSNPASSMDSTRSSCSGNESQRCNTIEERKVAVPAAHLLPQHTPVKVASLRALCRSMHRHGPGFVLRPTYRVSSSPVLAAGEGGEYLPMSGNWRDAPNCFRAAGAGSSPSLHRRLC